ncbi:MAG: M48 family metalloprotease [Actinomycetota bacterium]
MSTRSDWGATEVAAKKQDRSIRLIAAPVGVVVLIAVVMGSIVLGTWGVVIAAVLTGGFIAWVLDQPRRCLTRAGAVPLDKDRYPRPANVVAGLAPQIGIPPPELYVIDSGGPNALTSTRQGGAIALTRSLLDTYSRTELEAVLAHCLVRLRTGAVQRAMTRLAFGAVGRALVVPVGTGDDVAGAAVTRYPPALMSAIQKAEARAGWCAPLWFVPAEPAGRAPAQRIAALSDL